MTADVENLLPIVTFDELPACTWRELVPAGIYCRHERTHAPDNLVPAMVCTLCEIRDLPCDYPRPRPGEPEPKLPPLIVRLGNFSISLTRHALSGFEYREPDEIANNFQICRGCRLFNGRHCTHRKCGCNVSGVLEFLNALAWKSKRCPLKKWT